MKLLLHGGMVAVANLLAYQAGKERKRDKKNS